MLERLPTKDWNCKVVWFSSACHCTHWACIPERITRREKFWQKNASAALAGKVRSYAPHKVLVWNMLDLSILQVS